MTDAAGAQRVTPSELAAIYAQRIMDLETRLRAVAGERDQALRMVDTRNRLARECEAEVRRLREEIAHWTDSDIAAEKTIGRLREVLSEIEGGSAHPAAWMQDRAHYALHPDVLDSTKGASSC